MICYVDLGSRPPPYCPCRRPAALAAATVVLMIMLIRIIIMVVLIIIMLDDDKFFEVVGSGGVRPSGVMAPCGPLVGIAACDL